MEGLKFFDLIKKSFLALRKTNKKVWIIGIIISIISMGSAILQNTVLDILILTIGSIGLTFLIAIFTFVMSYYLYYSLYKSLFDTKLEMAPLGLVIKVNLIVFLKILGGTLLLIIPGIIVGLKYAPANYILCKHPELSSKEILNKTKELSYGFKWKMFVFNLFITIITSLVMFICSPNTFIDGYILVDILSMLITFVLTALTSVYIGLFYIYLYKDMENSKDKLCIE